MIVRGHATGLVTIDIHEFVTTSDSKIFNTQVIFQNFFVISDNN